MKTEHSLLGLGGAILAAGAAATIAARRWATADDPCKDDRDAELDGKPFTVTTYDGALLDGVRLGAEGGPLVVLSHCWTGDRSTWIPVARRLVAEGHTVVLYDQRGHGASTLGSEGATINRVGADLAAVLDAVDARDAIVAGHSMGGMAVMALLAEHPESHRRAGGRRRHRLRRGRPGRVPPLGPGRPPCARQPAGRTAPGRPGRAGVHPGHGGSPARSRSPAVQPGHLPGHRSRRPTQLLRGDRRGQPARRAGRRRDAHHGGGRRP